MYSICNVTFGLIFESDDIDRMQEKLEKSPEYKGRSDELMDIVSELYHDGYTHCMYYDGDENTADCIVTPDGIQRECTPRAFVIDVEKFPSPYQTAYTPEAIEKEFRDKLGFLIPDDLNIRDHIGIMVGQVYVG